MKNTLKPAVLIALILAAGFCLYMDARNSRAEGTRPEWKKISPFTELEFAGDQIVVEYEGKTRRLISIGGLSTDELVVVSKEHFEEQWQKRIREDIADVLMAGGAEDSETVALELENLETGDVVSVAEAPMTLENRKILYRRD